MERVFIEDSILPSLSLYLQSLLEDVNGTRYSEWKFGYDEYTANNYEGLAQHRSYYETRREFLINQINILCSQGIDFLLETSNCLSCMTSFFWLTPVDIVLHMRIAMICQTI